MSVHVDSQHRLDSIDEPAALLSRDHRVLAVNQAYRDRYPERLSLVGGKCHTVSHGYDHPCDLEGETCPVRACLATGRPSHVVHLHQHGDREELCNIELQPITNAQGEIVEFLEILHDHNDFGARSGLIGRSPAFLDAIGLAEAAAPTEVPVLLLGETGTGKERVAELIHAGSKRRDGPMVPVEVPGLQENLFASELFGHERGAFTGANRRHEGLVDATRGGTLFLDEIGDLSLPMQVKLLRLLEANTYRRVGSTEPIHADFRLVAATHRDLLSMVEAGSFRADLYYRLAVFPITLPALRDRGDDVIPLAHSFLAGRATMSVEAEAALLRWPWPGNLRELRNAIERAVVLAGGGEILAVHLPGAAKAAAPRHPAPWPWGDAVIPLADVEAQYLAWAAAKVPMRVALARALGLSRRQLYRRLAKRQVGDGAEA